MNKKGALFHWIIFGVLIALGVFFLSSGKEFTQRDVKGHWALHFLRENYLEAEKIVLVQESVERGIGAGVATEFAENGGYRAEVVSECGVFHTVNVWNEFEQWCLPAVQGNFSLRAVERLHETLPKLNFSEVHMTGTEFNGKGERGEISTLMLKEFNFPASQRYFYDTSFAVDIGYSFDEYRQLGAEAKQIVLKCRDKQEFITCVEQVKPAHWHLGFCENGKESAVEGRGVVFCVSSPNLYTLDTQVWGVRESVQYTIALDFTPSLILPVQELIVKYNSIADSYGLSFTSNNQAQAYKIYYTDWLAVQSSAPGKAADIFLTVPKDPALGFYETVFVKKEELLPCADVLEERKGYLCGEKVRYVLHDARLKSNQMYMLGVTAYDGLHESILREFVELK